MQTKIQSMSPEGVKSFHCMKRLFMRRKDVAISVTIPKICTIIKKCTFIRFIVLKYPIGKKSCV